MRNRTKPLLLLCLTVILAACGDDDSGGGDPLAGLRAELEASGLGTYLDQILPTDMSVNGEWEEYKYDTADMTAICVRGTPYQVNVRRGTSNNVLLYLEGGGACWSTETCVDVPIAKQTAGPAAGGGILDFADPDNPFGDWNVVYASYCDGSVFSGDNEVDYDGTMVYHHGLQNLSAAATLMGREFPNPGQIVVSGSSAGGYGTFPGYGVTRLTYEQENILVLNDSGPGVQNPDQTEALAERARNWDFVQFVPDSCVDCFPQLTYLSDWAQQRDPDLRVGYFNYLQDNVLQFFFGLDGAGVENLLREVTGDVQSLHPDRFKRFMPNGDAHTTLLSDTFYTLSVRGTSFRDWAADFLSDGSAWQELVEDPGE